MDPVSCRPRQPAHRARSVRRGRHGGWRAVVLVVTGLLLAGCIGSATSTTSAAPTPTAAAGVLDDDGRADAGSGQPTATATPPLHPSVDDYPAGRVVVDPGAGADLLPVAVRIADDPQRRAHGLMEVDEVPDGVGMWFTYDRDRTGAFWMKGTATDLDIAWVDDSGRIVAIDTMEVCDADPCPRYPPDAAYRSALEVRAGWYADHDIEVGDRILRDLE